MCVDIIIMRNKGASAEPVQPIAKAVDPATPTAKEKKDDDDGDSDSTHQHLSQDEEELYDGSPEKTVEASAEPDSEV